MLAKNYRMKEREVKRAMKRGSAIHGRYFTIVTFANKYTKNHRFAVVVSNKNTKSAVLRNAFRRHVYECVGELQDALLKTGQRSFTDIVLITKKGVKITKEEPNNADLSRDIQINLKKLLD